MPQKIPQSSISPPDLHIYSSILLLVRSKKKKKYEHLQPLRPVLFRLHLSAPSRLLLPPNLPRPPLSLIQSHPATPLVPFQFLGKTTMATLPARKSTRLPLSRRVWLSKKPQRWHTRNLCPEVYSVSRRGCALGTEDAKV